MTRYGPFPVARPEGRDALRVAVLLWLFVGVIVLVAVRNAPVDASGVAVFMAYEGEARRQFLGEATTEVLSAALDGVGPLRSAPPGALAAAGGGAEEDPGVEDARAVAERLGLSHFVLGSIALDGDQVTLSATLRETGGSRARLVTATGSVADVARLLDEVSTGLANRFFGTRGARPGEADELYSASLPALEAFFRGERAFNAGRYRQAGTLYERALREDPGFALAHHRLALAAERLDRHRLARQASAEAVRLGAGLSPRHRLLVRAQHAWVTGAASEAERLLAEAAAAYPGDPEAWARLAEVRFHSAAFRAAPPGAARAALDRALELDPTNPEFVEHAATLALQAGDGGRLAQLAAQAKGLADAPHLAATISALEEALGGTISDATEHRLRSGDGTAARDATRALATSAGTLGAALRTASLLTTEDRPAGVRALAEVWTAFLHLAHGRRGPAEEAFRRAAELDPDLAMEHRALAYTLPFLAYDLATTERAAREVEGWRPGGALTLAEPEPHYRMHLRSRPAFAPYLAGRLSLAVGDTAAARLWALELDAAPWNPDDPPLPTALVAGLRAETAHAAGDASDAVNPLVAAYHDMSYQPRQPSMILSLARERWLIAELLEDAGRTGAAMRWFEPNWGRVGEAVFLAPSYYRRGLLRQEAGDGAGARADFQRFLGLWSDADAELRGWVDDARARLEALTRG